MMAMFRRDMQSFGGPDYARAAWDIGDPRQKGKMLRCNIIAFRADLDALAGAASTTGERRPADEPSPAMEIRRGNHLDAQRNARTFATAAAPGTRAGRDGRRFGKKETGARMSGAGEFRERSHVDPGLPREPPGIESGLREPAPSGSTTAGEAAAEGRSIPRFRTPCHNAVPSGRQRPAERRLRLRPPAG